MDFEQLWLPLWPLASDDLAHGVYRMPRGSALQQRWIETNPHALSNLLVVDVDHSDAELRALAGRAKPTGIVSNRRNGHAHSVWALREPVTRTEYASRKAVSYAASVVEGLRRDLEGDAGYSGLITKNPVHEAWDTLWLAPGADPEHLWSLDELRDALGDRMPPPRWRRRKPPVGLGRNCTLFETARTWAYRAVRAHFGDPDGLSRAIHTEAASINAEFDEPLPASEVRATASSIHRWITTKSRMWQDGAVVYEATFTAIQSARGRKSGYARQSLRQLIKEEV